MTQNEAEPVEPPGRGPAVPDAETLLRIVTPLAAAAWLPHGIPSSAIFSFPKFSVDIERLTTLAALIDRWKGGNGIVSVNAGEARTHGFHAHHEPEEGNDAHANVYCDMASNERKRRARQLAALCRLVVAPTSQ